MGEVVKDIRTLPSYSWTTLFGSITNLYIPHHFWSNPSLVPLLTSFLGGSTVLPRMRYILGFFLAATFFISLIKRDRKVLYLILNVLFIAIWHLYFKRLIIDQTSIYHNTATILPTYLGAFVFSWIFFHLITLRKNSNNFLVFATLFSFPYLFILVPWLRSRFSIMDTPFRYMLVPATGMPLIFGHILWKAQKTARILMILFVFALVYLNYNYTQKYFNNLLEVRNTVLYDSLWKQFGELTIGFRPSKDFAVFYFEGNGGIIYNVFSFGFMPKLAVLHNISEENKDFLPLIYDDIMLTVEVMNKGYGPGRPVPPDKFYAFRIENGQLIDIKKDVMPKLRSLGYSYNNSMEIQKE